MNDIARTEATKRMKSAVGVAGLALVFALVGGQAQAQSGHTKPAVEERNPGPGVLVPVQLGASDEDLNKKRQEMDAVPEGVAIEQVGKAASREDEHGEKDARKEKDEATKPEAEAAEDETKAKLRRMKKEQEEAEKALQPISVESAPPSEPE